MCTTASMHSVMVALYVCIQVKQGSVVQEMPDLPLSAACCMESVCGSVRGSVAHPSLTNAGQMVNSGVGVRGKGWPQHCWYSCIRCCLSCGVRSRSKNSIWLKCSTAASIARAALLSCAGTAASARSHQRNKSRRLNSQGPPAEAKLRCVFAPSCSAFKKDTMFARQSAGMLGCKDPALTASVNTAFLCYNSQPLHTHTNTCMSFSNSAQCTLPELTSSYKHTQA